MAPTADGGDRAARSTSCARLRRRRSRRGRVRPTTSRAARGDLPPLLGVPIGLKDLYEVAGKPITASSQVLADVAEQDCDVWRRLREAGMVLVGHLHTHEFAAGGTTDQVGNPWDLLAPPGGRAADRAPLSPLACFRPPPAATPPDRSASRPLPRDVHDQAHPGICVYRWHRAALVESRPPGTDGAFRRRLSSPAPAMVGPDAGRAESCSTPRSMIRAPSATLAGARIAISPRATTVDLDDDVAAGFDRAIDACRRLGATIVEPPGPTSGSTSVTTSSPSSPPTCTPTTAASTTWSSSIARRFASGRARRTPRAAAATATPPSAPADATMTAAWADWIDEHAITALIEPTIPAVAPLRGTGYERFGPTST